MSITIAAITGVDPQASIRAIRRTQLCVPHTCHRLLVAPQCPGEWPRDEWRPLPDYGNNLNRHTIGALSAFLLFDFPRLVNTDFVIFVQWDGFAVNPDRWTDEFLDYDYIGAPWPLWLRLLMKPRGNLMRAVGSGGFSLRSRKWLQAGMTAPGFNGAAEDVFALRRMLPHWTRAGCRVAPMRVAKRWAIEHRLEHSPFWGIKDTFGWHGHAGGIPFYQQPILRAMEFVITSHFSLQKI